MPGFERFGYLRVECHVEKLLGYRLKHEMDGSGVWFFSCKLLAWHVRGPELYPQPCKAQTWEQTATIPARGTQRQEAQKFKAIVSHTVNSGLSG